MTESPREVQKLTVGKFAKSLVALLMPNGGYVFGGVQQIAAGRWCIPGTLEFDESAVTEIREITVPVEINAVRAVFVINGGPK